MQKYNHKKIEKKWQKEWEKSGINEAKTFTRDFSPVRDGVEMTTAHAGKERPKFYCLVEFPYPSGDGLHVGHVRSYTAMDIISRKKRMQGFNVLYPIGWDAFGLPTENFAIKTGKQPALVTKENVKVFKKQIQSLGISFDWSREINTTDPEYYKWTQWIFLKLFEKGLAYKKKMPINWCPKCKSGLANEEVVDGKCERCGAETTTKELEQWMLRITKYADRLIEDLETVDYLEKIKTQQINWIGRSYGVNFKHKIKDLNIEFEVFDSIPQTHQAQTFFIIAPEHLLVRELVKGTKEESAVMKFVDEIVKKKLAKKFDIDKDMEGVFTGRCVENYLGTGRDLPIWVASFALVDYGTGIVGCSAHDERDFKFAKKYNIPLKPVLFPKDKELAEKVRAMEIFYRESDGILEEPVEFKGRQWDEAREDIVDWIEKNNLGKRTVQYKLRDWVFSRQHYWGEPIPLIFCEKCGWVAVPEDELPVELPKVKKYEPTETGESPLAAIEKWVKTKCPKCGSVARRETDTMPNWAGSSWYYLAYLIGKMTKSQFPMTNYGKEFKYWLPVDLYNGGMEHTTLHLLYSRFWHKFLYDIGAVPTSEPYQRRISHGMILAPDGQKMSKSRGNVINPDKIVEEFGADVLRIYEMFMGPYDQAVAWDLNGVKGASRFVERVYHFKNFTEKCEPEVENLLHKTIKKVSEDIDERRFNTAVSAMMIFVNKIYEKGCCKECFKKFLLLLSPFAPHLAEELFVALPLDEARGRLAHGDKSSIFLNEWPTFDVTKIVDKMIEVVIQINGKVRGRLQVAADIQEKDILELALTDEKIKSQIEGKKIIKTMYVPKKIVSIVVK
ncbi:MAG: leucine--tRNA ligase [Candidatus Falkowbacteria bacterium]